MPGEGMPDSCLPLTFCCPLHRCRLEITPKMLENDTVISALPREPVLHDVETGLNVCALAPAPQQGAGSTISNPVSAMAQPATEVDDTHNMRAQSVQRLTVPQDSASCLTSQHAVAQLQRTHV